MVSNARVDFPEPESPVITINLFRGKLTLILLRLLSRAPTTIISSKLFFYFFSSTLNLQEKYMYSKVI